jgi:hypothetical protein
MKKFKRARERMCLAGMKVLLVFAVVVALVSHVNAQTAGGDPPGWFTEGDGTYTNCLSCLQNKIYGDIQEQHYRDQLARHRAEIILNQLTPDEEEATRKFRGCRSYAAGRTAQIACIPKGYVLRGGAILKRISEADRWKDYRKCLASTNQDECLARFN